jgi:hypothetical protein
MATTYYATNYQDQNQVSSDGGSFDQEFSYSMSAAFIINDLIYLCKIPVGCILLEWNLNVPALDSSTGSTIQIGDGTTADAFMTSTAAGQSGAGSRFYSLLSGVLGYIPKSYTAVSNIVAKVNTAPSGTATTTGTWKGWARFKMIGVTPTV